MSPDSCVSDLRTDNEGENTVSTKQKISTCLWFNGNAEAAVDFYLSVFEKSKVENVMRFGNTGPGPAGSVLSITFDLYGQRLIALNGGSKFTFSPAISLFVACDTQDEVDMLWDRLLDGGEAMRCGWLSDKFGVSWQIVPTALQKLLQGSDSERSSRAMAALMQMVKIDIRTLEQIYNG